jgi:hypothetical protein
MFNVPTLACLVEIGVIEDEKWAVSTQLKSKLLQSPSTMLCNELPNCGLDST